MSRPILNAYTGEIRDIPLSFKDSAGAAIDLTGATVYFTAKSAFSDADADAEFDEKITSHTTDASGLTAIPLDLSAYTVTGRSVTLIADIVLKDAAGDVVNQGQFDLVIHRSITDSTAD
jgi:hypothetical protein